MSFLEVSLKDVPELQALEEGEYQVQIASAEIGESDKTGGQYLMLRCEVPTVAESKDFTHVLMLPAESDSEKQSIKRLSRLKEAMEAFGYDYSKGIETDDLQGLQAWAYLTVEESGEFGEQNRIRRFIKPQTGKK